MARDGSESVIEPDEEETADLDRPDVKLAELPYLATSVEEWRRAFVFSLMANSDIHPWILVDNMTACEHWLKTGENNAERPSGVKPKAKA